MEDSSAKELPVVPTKTGVFKGKRSRPKFTRNIKTGAQMKTIVHPTVPPSHESTAAPSLSGVVDPPDNQPAICQERIQSWSLSQKWGSKQVRWKLCKHKRKQLQRRQISSERRTKRSLSVCRVQGLLSKKWIKRRGRLRQAWKHLLKMFSLALQKSRKRAQQYSTAWKSNVKKSCQNATLLTNVSLKCRR